MRGTVAKRLRRRASELWGGAIRQYPKLAKTSGKYVMTNVINHQRGGQTVFTTGTRVKLGFKRVLNNLKWQRKHGFTGPESEEIALDNAIKWSNAHAKS